MPITPTPSEGAQTIITSSPRDFHRGVLESRSSWLVSSFESRSQQGSLSANAAQDSVLALLNQYAAAGFRGRSEAAEMMSHAANLPNPKEALMISLPHHGGRTDH
jgi:hypothetical protein